MDAKPDLRFENFQLDRRNQELRRDSRLIALPPKTFSVLQYLAENPARLVTQEELLKALWGPIAVGDGLLRGYVRDLRQALGDDAANPRFIETLPRRGFRFLPKVIVDSGAVAEPEVSGAPAPRPELVGRDEELKSLHRLLGSALAGKRQMVFIAGEAGIGKTALLNAFLGQIGTAGAVRIACGQCIEQFGTREGYLPIFDALDRLCTGESAREMISTLTQFAPSWLVQMPGLLSADQRQALQNRMQGTNQARMLGEFCAALEAFTVQQPLILGLEDLHWTDLATLDLLSTISRRELRARLMVIGTYRPADMIVSEHPLKKVLQDLQAHRQCTELWPDHLTLAGVDTYLTRRFPGHEFPENLKRLIHRNTAGNPLFVTSIADELVRDNLIHHRDGRWQLKGDTRKLEAGKSSSLRQLIEGQLSRLSIAEQRLLEVAAIIGSEFDPALAAAALEIDPAEAEERCEALVRRRQVLRIPPERAERAGESSRYEFLHDLYRNAAFYRSSQGHRRRWYKKIAEKLAADFAGRLDEVATELAYYFEHANLPLEAAEYCALAGERALRQLADAASIIQFRQGIELLENIPASVRPDALEFRLKLGLAAQLSQSQGYHSHEIEGLLARTIVLTEGLADTVEAFGPMRFLHSLLSGRFQHRQAYKLCEKLDRMAEKTADPILRAEARRIRGQSAWFLGNSLEARECYDEAIAAHHREDRKGHPFSFIEDPDAEVSALSVLSTLLWINGYPDQALERAEAARAAAKKSGMFYSIAVADFFFNQLMYLRRDVPAALKEAQLSIAFCAKHGISLWLGQARLLHGWALAMGGRIGEGIKELESAFADGAVAAGGSLTWLAEAYLQAEKTSKGLLAVERGLKFCQEHEEGISPPDLQRTKGELLLQRADAKGRKRTDAIEMAERSFLTAIERARNNHARSFELRAAISLYRLWSKQGKRPEARRILAEVYDWFTEGKDTLDLVEARRLLGERRA